MKARMRPTISWTRTFYGLPEKGSEIYAFDSMMKSVDKFIVDFDPILLDPDYTHWIYSCDFHKELLGD